MEKVMKKKIISDLEATSKILEVFCEELSTECPKLSEEEFRERWARFFFYTENPPMGLWVSEVCKNAQLPVEIIGGDGEVVCIIPPLTSGIRNTITKGTAGASLQVALTETKERGKLMPGRMDELVVDTVTPYTERATTDPKWGKEWIRTLKYFNVDFKAHFGIKDTESEGAVADDQGEDHYDEFDEI